MRSSSYEGHRKERYFVKLLDNQDREIRVLETSDGGSLTFDNDAPIKGGGQLTITNGGNINWESHRIQPWYELEGVEAWPMGTFVATKPGDSVTSESVRVTLQLHDKLIILEEDRADAYYSVARGAVVTDHIRDIIASAGTHRVNMTESPLTAKDMMVWEAGTSKLTIINDLLKFLNYKPLFMDAWGIYQVAPYVAPTELPVVKTFQKGREAIHTPEWNRNQDIASIPNKVVLLADGNEAFEGLVGTAQITDPTSPYSYESRGRWVVYTETGVDAESPSVINDLAKRKLTELISPQSIIDIEHAVVPIMLGDTIRFITDNADGDVDILATVERLDYTLTPGSLCKATWNEVPKI